MSYLKFLIKPIAVLIIPIGTMAQVKNSKVDIYELPVPKNIEECFTFLEMTMTEDEIKLIKELPEDSISNNAKFRNGADFFHAWKLSYGSGSRLGKYFNKMGLIGAQAIYETILVSYHRNLNSQYIELQAQIKKRRAIQNTENEAYKIKIQKDTLNGVYIPKNISECMFELEKTYGEKSKIEFRNQEESKVIASAYKLGTGFWIRNKWGLSDGSRLQRYFYENGVREPADMTWIILTCYYKYANKKPLGFRARR
jgi:hypothetical protein